MENEYHIEDNPIFKRLRLQNGYINDYFLDSLLVTPKSPTELDKTYFDALTIEQEVNNASTQVQQAPKLLQGLKTNSVSKLAQNCLMAYFSGAIQGNLYSFKRVSALLTNCSQESKDDLFDSEAVEEGASTYPLHSYYLKLINFDNCQFMQKKLEQTYNTSSHLLDAMFIDLDLFTVDELPEYVPDTYLLAINTPQAPIALLLAAEHIKNRYTHSASASFACAEQAALQKHHHAYTMLGKFYEKGYGVKQDSEHAFKWYLAGLTHGDYSSAQYVHDNYTSYFDNPKLKVSLKDCQQYATFWNKHTSSQNQ